MKKKFSMKLLQQGMTLFLSWSLVLVGVRDWFAYQIDVRRPTGAKSRQTSLGSQCQALKRFPTALTNMNLGLAWTSELGDAQAVIDRIFAGERAWASILALLLVLAIVSPI
jgi:hypothetical protein